MGHQGRRPFPNATEAFVAKAVTADGQQVALKIPIAGRAQADRELSLLQTANGRGYVRFLRDDGSSGAMLLERLGPQLANLGLPIEEQIRIICRTLQHAWMPLPPGARFPTGAEKASEMSSYISTVWRRLGRPCSEKVIEVALRFAEAGGMPSIRQIPLWLMATRTHGTRCSTAGRMNASLSTPTACSSSARTI